MFGDVHEHTNGIIGGEDELLDDVGGEATSLIWWPGLAADEVCG